MNKPEKNLMHLLALLLVLPILLCATFSMAAMATAEVIDPETYNGTVILEDSALIVGIGEALEEAGEATNAPVTDTPVQEPTQAPTDTPTQEPTQAPTQEPTQAPTAPPAASYEILMEAPTGWYANRAAMEVTVKDAGGTGWQSIKITMGDTILLNGVLPSGHLWLELLDNCTVEVIVTDPSGKKHSQSVAITCFDKEIPTLKASVKGEYLNIEATDAQSGVAAVQINGSKYTALTNGKLEIHLKGYEDAYEQLLAQAVDKVGNVSKAIAVANPFFHNVPTTAPTVTPKPTNTPKPTKQPSGGGSGSNGGSGSGSSGSGNRATPTPVPTATPVVTVAPLVTATAAPMLTEVETGSPFSYSGNSFTRDLLYDKFTNKQFIAIETRSGDVFYLCLEGTVHTTGLASGFDSVRNAATQGESPLLRAILTRRAKLSPEQNRAMRRRFDRRSARRASARRVSTRFPKRRVASRERLCGFALKLPLAFDNSRQNLLLQRGVRERMLYPQREIRQDLVVAAQTKGEFPMKNTYDPYRFLRERAAALWDEGRFREAKRLLRAIDRMWAEELREERHEQAANE